MINLERIAVDVRNELGGPLHLRLRNSIRAQILDGTLRPGDPLPPERILESRLGISRYTIHMAIRALVDEGLMNTILGSGNFVRGGRSPVELKGVVGVIIPAWFSTLYMHLVTSFTQRLRPAGYPVELNIYEDSPESFLDVFENTVNHALSGLAIVAPYYGKISQIFETAQIASIPKLMIARDFKLDLDYVGVDNFSMGYQATKNLIQLGHQGILHVHYPAVNFAGHERAGGYVKAMLEVGLTPQFFPRPLDVLEPFLPAEFAAYGLSDLAELRNQICGAKITAAFCASDENAIWLQKELRRCNRVVPHNFSLIGVDNQPYAEFFDAPLSTYQLPGSEMGVCAADIMLRRLAGEKFDRQFIQLPATFIARASVAPPAP